MSRQIVSLYKVLPPFEIVSYPETIEVITKTPQGDLLAVSVPIVIYATEQDYITDTTESIAVIRDGMVIEKAAELRLVTKEQGESLKSGDTKISDLDTIVEPIDEFAMKMQAKTLDTVE